MSARPKGGVFKVLGWMAALGVGGLTMLVGALVGGGMALGTLDATAAPSAAAQGAIPAAYVSLYNQAAATCPGLSWAYMAAIGTVESTNGANAGVSSAGAVGPMQFERDTFAAYDHPVGVDESPNPAGSANPPDINDPADAIYAAARYLCSLGAVNDPNGAAVAYNCGNDGPACQAASAGYAGEVIALAERYQAASSTTSTADVALLAAISQLGVPYRWGGESPGQAFDCSGLVQWSYAQAGVALPRVAQDQFDATTTVSVQAAGDLVFFGTDDSDVTHVGIVVAPGEMVDAPDTGAVVREEAIPTVVGQPWGADTYLGAHQVSG